MFKNNEREFVISLPKQPKCKREQMLLSLPKKWNITVPILFFPSFLMFVGANFIERNQMSPFFQAMLPVTSTLSLPKHIMV